MVPEAAMTVYETINVVISGLGVFLSSAIVVLMWWGIREMARANRDRAAQAAQQAAQAAQQAAQAAKDAAEGRKVTQGMLAALQELLRRTSPPRPDPAE